MGEQLTPGVVSGDERDSGARARASHHCTDMDDNRPRALIAIADPGRPMHVGALLGNSPAMLRSMAAAAFGGYVLCGINTTRRGDGLAADIGKPPALVLATPEQPDDTRQYSEGGVRQRGHRARHR